MRPQPKASAGPSDTPVEPPEPDAESGAVAQADTSPPEPTEPPEPEVPKAPADHGQIKPSDSPPKPSELTMHAVAGFAVVPLYDKPNIKSKKLGYLRLGQRLMVTPKVEGEGCKRGWYQTGDGTYVCSGQRHDWLLVDAKKAPYFHKPPPKPRTDEAFPYDYAYVRKWNTPMWWRVPNKEERAEATKQRAVLEAKREGLPPPGEETKNTRRANGEGVKPPEQPANGVAPAKGSAADKKLQASKQLPSVKDDVTPAAVATPRPRNPSRRRSRSRSRNRSSSR